MMRLACFSKTEKKSFPDVNADIDNFKLQNLFFLHNICVIIMILWWYFSSVWSFCSRPTDAIWQENQCFFYLVVLVWTMALLAVKTLNIWRICFDPWLLTRMTDRKGIILNNNQLQYLNELIKPIVTSEIIISLPGIIGHFTVMDGSEAKGDLVLIQTFFALLWKLFLKNTSQHKNNLIYIIKQEGLYQKKVTLSLAPSTTVKWSIEKVHATRE